MKSWFGIIRGETEESSNGIAKEIEGVEQQLQEAQIKAETMREELKQAGIERLAGEGNEKAIAKIESDIRSIERDMALLEDVKKSLSEKRAESITRENFERVAQIDKEIEVLRASKKDMNDKAWVLAADLAGLLYLSQGTHDSEILNILNSDSAARIKFRATVKKIVDGQRPFLDQERELMTERKKLKG